MYNHPLVHLKKDGNGRPRYCYYTDVVMVFAFLLFLTFEFLMPTKSFIDPTAEFSWIVALHFFSFTEHAPSLLLWKRENSRYQLSALFSWSKHHVLTVKSLWLAVRVSLPCLAEVFFPPLKRRKRNLCTDLLDILSSMRQRRLKFCQRIRVDGS